MVSLRSLLLEKLSLIGLKRKAAWCMIGDFNDILSNPFIIKREVQIEILSNFDFNFGFCSLLFKIIKGNLVLTIS